MKTITLINSILKDEQLKLSHKLDDMLHTSSEKVFARANIYVVDRFFSKLKPVTADIAEKNRAYLRIRKA